MHPLVLLCLLACTQRSMQDRQVSRLIEQLGDRVFAVREASQKSLLAIGSPAVVQLEKAATASHDPEIRRRSRAAAETIFRRCLGPEASLPHIWYFDVTTFVREAPRYEPRAVAEARRVRTVPSGVVMWRDGMVSRIMTREYLKDLVRRGASRAQIQALLDAVRRRAFALHPPLTRYPGYANAVKHMRQIPWYFLRDTPAVGP